MSKAWQLVQVAGEPVCVRGPAGKGGEQERERGKEMQTGREGAGSPRRKPYVRSDPGLGKPSRQAFCPRPRGHTTLPPSRPRPAPGHGVRVLNHPGRPTLRGVSEPHTASLGDQGPERPGTCSAVTQQVGPEPGPGCTAHCLHLQVPVLHPAPLSPPTPRSLLMPHPPVSCRDTKASRDPSGLRDQRAKRWVLGCGEQLPPDTWAGRSKPRALCWGSTDVCSRLPLLASRRPGGRSPQTYARRQNKAGLASALLVCRSSKGGGEQSRDD